MRNRTNWYAWIAYGAASFAAASAILLAGCGGGGGESTVELADDSDAPASDDATEAEAPAEIEPGNIRPMGVNEVIFSGSGDAYALELIEDRYFDDFDPDSAAQRAWTMDGDAGAFDKEAAPDEVDANYVVVIDGSEGKTALHQETAALLSRASETYFTGTAWAQATGPNALALVVSYPLGGGRENQFAAIHPGDGQWRQLEVSGAIEMDGKLPVTMRLEAEGPEPAKVGRVSLRVSDEAPAGDGNLIANAGFDDRAYFQATDYTPWNVTAWGGNEVREVALVAQADAPQRRFVAQFPDIDQGAIALFQMIEILPEHAGKTIKASAWGKSETRQGVVMLIRGDIGGETINSRSAHPGNSSWYQFEWEYQIPDDVESGEFSFGLGHYAEDGAGGPAFVDDARLTIE